MGERYNLDFMYTRGDTVLVCVDMYDNLHYIVGYTWLIIVTLSHAVSLLGLMASFIIYIGNRELHTMEGILFIGSV